MKLLFHLPVLCYFFSALGCTQNHLLPASKKDFGNTCTDTLVVFKQITIPGAQQTDIEGNPIHQKILNYTIFLLSNSQELKIDSLQAGKTSIRNLKVTLADSTPIYRETVGKKMILVNKTNCAVHQIQFTFTASGETNEMEENKIIVYYSQKGLQKKLSAKEVKLLPQMITE